VSKLQLLIGRNDDGKYLVSSVYGIMFRTLGQANKAEVDYLHTISFQGTDALASLTCYTLSDHVGLFGVCGDI
jgi:hypothetical protein